MRKFLITLVVIVISCISFNVYAITENTTEENKVQEANTVEKEKVEETPTETKKNEIMYVQERCNIRSSYSVESNRVGGLDVGTEVTVIAEYSNGWYKIKYNDGEAFVKSGILRSTKPEISEETEESEQKEQPSEQPSQEIQISEQTKVENTETSIEQAPQEINEEVDVEYAEIINEVGVLPEVGKNIADYLYIFVICMSIFVIVYVKIKF